MRNKSVATLAAVYLAAAVGCQSAPKLAFWKSGDKSDVESTALAHSAPALPADVAKQAETLAAATPSIDLAAPAGSGSLSSAPPYSPAPPYMPPAASSPSAAAPPFGAVSAASQPTPPAYPKTPAPAFASSAPATATPATNPVASMAAASKPSTMPAASASPSIAASTPPALYNRDQSADLGSVDMPYNPNAVPPAKTVASSSSSPVTPTAAPATQDRYASSNLSSGYPTTGAPSMPPIANSQPAGATPSYGTGDRYANVTAAPATPPGGVNLASTGAPATSTAPSAYTAPNSSTPAVSSYSQPAGGRYGAVAATPGTSITPSGPASGVVTPTVPPVSSAPSFSSTPQVASAKPYRPGGTSTYDGLSSDGPSVEIATRPNPPESTVPNVATPSVTPESTPAPRYR